ncbi:MAG TPA: magnesium/cobalt transporter CorA [Polyangiaceae bacterium]|jgi:magnesium transporter|nr:magnesium/cobalt transporter CorA [Polyangiaceae bacterium]
MFRALEIDARGEPVLSEGADVAFPPNEGQRRWIDLLDPTAEDLELLRVRFGFHPLALEDCAHLDQRPKLEEFGDHTFLVTQGFGCTSERVRDLQLFELHAFLGQNYLVTVHTGEIPAVSRLWSRGCSAQSPLERGPDFLYYLIADALVDEGFPILDRIGDEIEELENEVLLRPQRDDFARIFELKRVLVQMRKVLTPQRDMIAMLARRGDARVSDRTALYFRDIFDHLVRLSESIEANRDLLGNSVDAYLSSVSNRTNEVMKYLTVLSAVFLPLSFIVGFFGQNFDDLPGFNGWSHSHFLMYAMMLVCLSVPFVMLWWFKSKGWLD